MNKENNTSILNWFISKIKDISKKTLSLLDKKIKKESSDFSVGSIYMYVYDPKLKDVLPYYDKFPVIILLKLNVDGKGFLGLNLHYLPPKLRVQFLTKLSSFVKSDANDIKKIEITYEILKISKSLKEFRPCLKMYLFDHVRSRITRIPSDEWYKIILLPTEKFANVSEKKVWQDSLDIINK